MRLFILLTLLSFNIFAAEHQGQDCSQVSIDGAYTYASNNKDGYVTIADNLAYVVLLTKTGSKLSTYSVKRDNCKVYFSGDVNNLILKITETGYNQQENGYSATKLNNHCVLLYRQLTFY